jgi:hypothetical protein
MPLKACVRALRSSRPSSAWVEPPVSVDGLGAVRDLLLASPELSSRLATIVDVDELRAEVVALASTLDAEVTPADLDDALREGTRRGLERRRW